MAWLSVALTLAAYALASVLGGLAVAALSGPIARLGVSSTRRSRLLLALRLLPSAAGLIVSLGMVLPRSSGYSRTRATRRSAGRWPCWRSPGSP